MNTKDAQLVAAYVISGMGLAYGHAGRNIEGHVKEKVNPDDNPQTYREGIQAAFYLSHLERAFNDAGKVIAGHIEDD